MPVQHLGHKEFPFQNYSWAQVSAAADSFFPTQNSAYKDQFDNDQHELSAETALSLKGIQFAKDHEHDVEVSLISCLHYSCGLDNL